MVSPIRYRAQYVYTEASFLVRQRRNLHVSEYDSPKNTRLCTRVSESDFPIYTINRNKAFEGNDNKCLAESRRISKARSRPKKQKKDSTTRLGTYIMNRLKVTACCQYCGSKNIRKIWIQIKNLAQFGSGSRVMLSI